MAIDWSSGFSAKYYAIYLDAETWQEEDRLEIVSGSVTKNETDLRESADLTCRDFDPETERWIRVYLDAYQNGDIEHVPIFTGLASSPSMDVVGSGTSNKITCYSVLKPVSDMLLPLGWYARAGSNGAEQVKELLEVTNAPVTIEGVSDALESDLIAEGGETNLTMVDKILNTINWRLRIDGDGSITICEAPSEPVEVFGSDFNDIIEVDVSIEKNWFDCPNVFRASNDEFMAIARDEDPDSIYSIPSRGREIWMEETDVQLTKDESIGDFAKRRLSEEQTLNYKLNYSRRFNPDVLVSDLVEIRYPRQNISGLFQISSQSIQLTYGAKTGEEAKFWVTN